MFIKQCSDFSEEPAKDILNSAEKETSPDGKEWCAYGHVEVVACEVKQMPMRHHFLYW
jgi:hypothetical protein